MPRKVKFGEAYHYGEYTRGIGTGSPRVRFACRPELAVLTLRTAREAPADDA